MCSRASLSTGASFATEQHGFSPLKTHLLSYLETLCIGPGSCKGFEDEALGACMGLVHYLSMSAPQQVAWLTAVQNATMNSTGTLDPGPANKSFFYHAILNRKNSAFGYNLAPWNLRDIDPVDYPWALLEPLFRSLDKEIKRGKGLAAVPEIKYEEVVAKIVGWNDKHGAATPIAGVGILLVRKLVQKYAPKLVAAFLGDWALLVIGIVGFTAIGMKTWSLNVEIRMQFITLQ